MALIYIVEDEDSIREIEEIALKTGGHETKSFASGEDFFAAIEGELPELAVLDVMLPDIDGNEIVKRLRENPDTCNLPLILVTAKTGEADVVRSLEGGADDYLKKPFSVMELLARVKALLRRTDKASESLTLGEILLDEARRKCFVEKTELELTYKEYELLKYLIANKGIVLSRDKILLAVWHADFDGETRTVDMHVNTLRKKLGHVGERIKTVRNVGYVIE